jgi:curved DNA-binding protein
MAVGFRDYYDVLGVDRNASEDEIRRVYRRLARENHPDINKEPGAEDRFKEISEAYEVLRDPEKRERYDRLGPNWRAGQDVSDAPGYEQYARGGFDDVHVEFGDGDFSDFFEGLFGGRARGRGGGRTRARRGGGAEGFDGFAMRGSDQEATLELSLEEAFAGGKRRITLGDGRDYEVTIPPGVRDGQRIRLAGQGLPGAGGPPGDLYLRVRITPHPRFRVEGRDLYLDLPVAPWEAALGATVPVPTLEGQAKVRVGAGSSSGRKLRLRGQGMPGPDGRRGDLYAVVMIMVPKRLTDDERRLFEQLASVSSFDPRRGT